MNTGLEIKRDLSDWAEWKHLVFGRFSLAEVQACVRDSDWQVVRLSMLSTSLEFKYETLTKWLAKQGRSYSAKVQVTNYVYALKRAGLIKEQHEPADQSGKEREE